MRYAKPAQSWSPQFSGSSIKQANQFETGICSDDIEKCLKSNMLFGFKFVGETGLDAIKCLRKLRK